MRGIICFIFLIVSDMISVQAQQVGDIIIKSDFGERDTPIEWEGARYKMVTEDGVSALRIRRKNGTIHTQIPAEKIRGTKVIVKIRAKAEGLSELPQPWNGVKLMLYAKQPWNEMYMQQPLPGEGFDWTDFSFSALIPPDADSISLIMGLEKVKGKVWFDNLEIKVIDTKPSVQKEVAKQSAINNKTNLRGVMVPTFLNDEGLTALKDWGANHIRWQLTWAGFPNSYADTATYADYRLWLDGVLSHLDTMLPKCRANGIKVVIDLHTLPGGRQKGSYTHKLFAEKEWQDAFRTIWKDIAARYKDEPAVWGYDLANEPVEGVTPENLMSWQQLAAVTAADVRAIDKGHVIIIEGAPNGGPEALSVFKPVAVDNVVYSFHMYVPEDFTHQGVGGRKKNISYPGKVSRWDWNIATMRKALQPIVKWQQENNAQIYVGEFSAIRWAPDESAYYYMRDCISLFEEYGWNWAYHAFREYDGWSVEHNNNEDDHNIMDTPTERKQLLIQSFSKNKE